LKKPANGISDLKAKLATLVIAAVAALTAVTGLAQQPSPQPPPQQPTAAGLWQKLDDDKKPVGWFLFVDHNGVFEGHFAKLFPEPGEAPNPVCSKCTDDRKGAPLLGLPFVREMKRTGLKYEGGTVLDPRDGKIYTAQMTLDPAKQTLTLRGYVLGMPFLGKDDVWHRLPDTAYKQLDPAILAKFAPERAEAVKGAKGKAKAPQK
jgi:hypothetical protein